MKWTNFTDIITCRCVDHLFVIWKRQTRGDIIQWACFDPTGLKINSGTTTNITVAKRECSRLCQQLLTTS